jgi:hypothetical protein
MKNAVLAILAVCVSISLMSCGASQEVTSFWKNPEMTPIKKPYTKIFISVLTADRGARNVVESDLSTVAKGRGIEAVKSIDIYPNISSKKDMPSEEAILAKIKELNCDGIFVLSLLDVKAEQRYVPGTTTYAAGYAPYPSYGYYGGYYGYYSYNYNVISEPGYYTTDKTYFIEANLYDAATGKIVFSMQSTALNPGSISDFSKEYTWLLGDKLKAEAPKAEPGK